MYRIMCLLVCLAFLSCTSTSSSQKKLEDASAGTSISGYYSFDNALEEGIKKIHSDLPENSKLAILAFKSDNENLSSYIVEEMYDKLINLGMTVLERNFTDAIAMEVGYQLSGEVDDREIVKIGNQLGANYVITGQITFSGEAYRLRIFAIDIEKAQRISSSSLNISSNDKQINYLLTSHNMQTDVVQHIEPKNYQGHPIYRTNQGVEQVLVGFHTYNVLEEYEPITYFVYVDKLVYEEFIFFIEREFGKLDNYVSIELNEKLTTVTNKKYTNYSITTRNSMMNSYNALVDFAQSGMAIFNERYYSRDYAFTFLYLIIRSDIIRNNIACYIIILTDKINIE